MKLIQKPHLSLLFLVAGLCQPAFAGEFALGVGAADVFSRNKGSGGIVSLDYLADPFWERNRVDLKFTAAAEAFFDGSYWIGAGVVAGYKLSDKWILEGSFLPGYYHKSSTGVDLYQDLEFRTSLGLAYQLSDTTNIRLRLSHVSNANLGVQNPGLEILSIQYGWKY